MKTLITVPMAAAPSKMIRQPRTIRYRLSSKRSLLRRFQNIIQSSDWEDRYLCHSAIDKITLGIIVASALYFLPILGSMILR